MRDRQPPTSTAFNAYRSVVICRGLPYRSISSIAIPISRLVSQPRRLLGVLQKREHAIPDQVDGRFMSGDEQQEAHGQKFIGAEVIASVLTAISRLSKSSPRASRRCRINRRRKTTKASADGIALILCHVVVSACTM